MRYCCSTYSLQHPSKLLAILQLPFTKRFKRQNVRGLHHKKLKKNDLRSSNICLKDFYKCNRKVFKSTTGLPVNPQTFFSLLSRKIPHFQRSVRASNLSSNICCCDRPFRAVHRPFDPHWSSHRQGIFQQAVSLCGPDNTDARLPISVAALLSMLVWCRDIIKILLLPRISH